MRKRDKIRILKKALKFLEQAHADGIYVFGICSTIDYAANSPSTDVALFGIKLPERGHGYCGFYCWPQDKRGAVIRRIVLKNAIKRLETT